LIFILQAVRTPRGEIETAKDNNVPNEDFNDEYDEMCVQVLKNAENAGLCKTTSKIYLFIYFCLI